MNAEAEPPPQPAVPRAWSGLLRALNAVGTVLILALMLLTNADVVSRAAFNAPVRGTTELISLAIVVVVFLQLPNTLAAGALIRTEALIEQLESRRPRSAQLVHAAYELCGVALFAGLAWAMVPAIEESLDIGAYVGARGDFTAPIWPMQAVVLGGAVLTAATYALLALARVRRAFA